MDGEEPHRRTAINAQTYKLGLNKTLCNCNIQETSSILCILVKMVQQMDTILFHNLPKVVAINAIKTILKPYNIVILSSKISYGVLYQELTVSKSSLFISI